MGGTGGAIVAGVLCFRPSFVLLPALIDVVNEHGVQIMTLCCDGDPSVAGRRRRNMVSCSGCSRAGAGHGLSPAAAGAARPGAREINSQEKGVAP